jgi:hypothetical protein
MAARDPLSAVPVAATGTTLETSPSGGGVLTRRVADASGLRAWLARKLRFREQHRYELDEVGACFWLQVDGQRPLAEIQRTLCSRYGLSPEQGRRAIIEFTALLMRRNLLLLRLEET